MWTANKLCYSSNKSSWILFIDFPKWLWIINSVFPLQKLQFFSKLQLTEVYSGNKNKKYDQVWQMVLIPRLYDGTTALSRPNNCPKRCGEPLTRGGNCKNRCMAAVSSMNMSLFLPWHSSQPTLKKNKLIRYIYTFRKLSYEIGLHNFLNSGP